MSSNLSWGYCNTFENSSLLSLSILAPLTALLPPSVAAEKAWIARQHVLSQGQHPKAVLPWVWKWMTEASAAFQILKQKVAAISALRPLDYAAALSGKAPIYLFTDASNMVPVLG